MPAVREKVQGRYREGTGKVQYLLGEERECPPSEVHLAEMLCQP